MTSQRLEVRVRQHIPRSLLSGRLTSRHSQAMDSAIGEHFLTINSCRTGYEDDCFSVLHRARDKSHRKFLEGIYISINRTSRCRQLNNHILNILGKLLDTGVTCFFLGGVLVGEGSPSIWPSWLYIYIYIYTPFLIEFPESNTWKEPDEKVLRCFIVLFSSPTVITNDVFVYYIIYIYIYIVEPRLSKDSQVEKLRARPKYLI